MSDKVPVGPGTRVTLHFALRLADGSLIDQTGEKPASFIVGDGNLLPGFEKKMFGLRAGEKEVFDIPAEAGFGLVNDANIHTLRKKEFNKLTLTEGLVVSFSDKDGQERPGVVSRLLGDLVIVDFNHPLAGKDLVFEVEILAVEQVSLNIIRM